MRQELLGAITEYNSLAEDMGLSGRVWYINGLLVLGSMEQFNYESYQCKLVEGLINEEDAYTIVKAMSRTLVFG